MIRRAWLYMAAGCLLMMAIPAAADGPPVGPHVESGAFTLTASDGSPVTERSYRGKVQLIYFGYTFCPDACPTALSEIASALEALGSAAARVQALFITIDPRRDTAAVLADYVKAFDARIVGLTGTPVQTAAAARAYGVIYERQESESEPGRYLYDHSSYIYVMDVDGKFTGALASGADPAQIAQLVRQALRD